MESVSRAAFQKAKKDYEDFVNNRYKLVKAAEETLYQDVIDKLEKVQLKTNEIGAVEEKAQVAKNTLVSGETIQMISFEEGIDKRTRDYWADKVPVVSFEVNGKKSLFSGAIEDKFCLDNPPLKNIPQFVNFKFIRVTVGKFSASFRQNLVVSFIRKRGKNMLKDCFNPGQSKADFRINRCFCYIKNLSVQLVNFNLGFWVCRRVMMVELAFGFGDA